MCHGKGVGYQHGHGCGPMPFMQGIPHMMKKFAHHMEGCMGRAGSWIPYNLERREDGYIITVPIPGRTKEDVSVSLIGNNLNIKASKPKTDGEPKEESGEPENPFLKFFFKFIDVDMDIPLPANADLDSIKSVMANGLLKVKVGKKPSKNIDINDAGNN